jgi:hypothetical protein
VFDQTVIQTGDQRQGEQHTWYVPATVAVNVAAMLVTLTSVALAGPCTYRVPAGGCGVTAALTRGWGPGVSARG